MYTENKNIYLHVAPQNIQAQLIYMRYGAIFILHIYDKKEE